MTNVINKDGFVKIDALTTDDLTSLVDAKPHKNHPLKIRKGKGRGKLPHQVNDDFFSAWLKENKMTEADYFMTVGAGDSFAKEIEHYGAPVFTKALTADQSGWARIDHPDHFGRPGAKWFINPDKPGRPIPARFLKFKTGRKL